MLKLKVQLTENCCSKQDHAINKKQDCCQKGKGICIKNNKDCKGDCENSSCHCTPNTPNCILSSVSTITKYKATLVAPKYFYQDTYYGQGFLSIWKPPKIV
ncbi:MAG: hypothetical protein R2801_05720 [Chitinophagales bacterium]